MFSNPRSIDAIRTERYRTARSEPVDTGWYRPRRGVIVRMVWDRAPWWRAFVQQQLSSSRAHRGSR
jgi:hypothetical protein